MLNPSRPIAILATSAGLALAPAVIAACGGGGATAATKPAKTTSTPAPTSIGTGKTALGTILVDSQGRTLYLFTHDSGTTSMCSGPCATAWPPLVAAGAATATSGANAALLGTSRRADGTTQVTYNGHPLYRFVKDQNAGETNGQGVTAFGGSWFAVTVAGNQAGHQSSSKAPSQASPAPAAPAAPTPTTEAPAPKPAPEPAPPKPAPEPAPPKPAPEPKPAPPAASGIPQNGGGDGDGDNNGGPSDGDGNV
jgi:predicted lipoprotein with Yx(FWY)xxD motif